MKQFDTTPKETSDAVIDLTLAREALLHDNTPSGEFALIRIERALSSLRNSVPIGVGSVLLDDGLPQPTSQRTIAALHSALNQLVEMHQNQRGFESSSSRLVCPKDCEFVDLRNTQKGIIGLDRTVRRFDKMVEVLRAWPKDIITKSELFEVAANLGFQVLWNHCNAFASDLSNENGIWVSIPRTLQFAGVLGPRQGASGNLHWKILIRDNN